ncbi:MAG: hypothetical protein ACRC8B_22385, partial [Aeromonas sobria]|uniref:hypothetical protein n=1 Tax=Aeromonas sobria TaxID=646 RepID=UPI003F3B3AD1
LSGIAGMEEVESLSDTHKKSETNQQVSDFHTSEGSVNGSLTDRHYPGRGGFFMVKRQTFSLVALGYTDPII